MGRRSIRFPRCGFSLKAVCARAFDSSPGKSRDAVQLSVVRSRAGSTLTLVHSAPPKTARRPAAKPTPSLDDAELLATLRRGDPMAAAALYRRALPQVERTIS